MNLVTLGWRGLLRRPLRRDVAGNGNDPAQFMAGVQNRADDHVPPLGRTLGGRTISGKSADASGADFYKRLGQAALAARGADRRKLERFYWFTVEFGLIRTAEGLRVYGNGILSSAKEIVHALGNGVEKIDFDPATITSCDYDVSHLQPRLFVIDAFDQLVEGFDAWARRERFFGI